MAEIHGILLPFSNVGMAYRESRKDGWSTGAGALQKSQPANSKFNTWYTGNRQIFSVSVNCGNRIEFS